MAPPRMACSGVAIERGEQGFLPGNATLFDASMGMAARAISFVMTSPGPYNLIPRDWQEHGLVM